MAAIGIKNVGAIENLSIPIPDDGGVLVLKGRQGIGKSTALEATRAMASGKGKLSVRDGQLNGSIEGMGVTIRLGRSTRYSGELEAQSLESKFSVADLVEPGIKSPDAADARRIKALVQLARVQPSPSLFYDLVGGREEFEQVVSAAAVESDDLVLMSERIKRDLESGARKEESQAEHAEGRFRGSHEAASGIDVAAECDSEKLQSALNAAVRNEEGLKAQAKSHEDAIKAAKEAQESIEDAEAAYDGPSLSEATEVLSERQNASNEATSRLAAAENGVQQAERALERAKAERELAQSALESAKTNLENASKVLKQVNQHQDTLASWKRQIAASIPEAPSEIVLADAAAKVLEARQAVEQGALIRKAKQHLSDADVAQKEAQGHRQRAKLLREAAKGTDEVLSGVVGSLGTPLRVEAGRLVLDTPRGVTHFADLSDGERWCLGLDIGIEAVGPRGLLTIPQGAWGEIQPANKRRIAEHLRNRKAVAITAEVTDDNELTAEVFPTN